MIKVLLVEDDGLFSQRIIDAAVGTDYNIIVCNNGLDAINCYDRERPDIALIDIELENSPINGISVAEYIVHKGRIPFGFITRHVSEKSIYYNQARRVFPNLYFPKTPAIDTPSIHHILDELAWFSPTERRFPKEPVDIITTNSGLFVPLIRDKDQMVFLAREEIVYITISKGFCKIYPDTNISGKKYYKHKDYYFLVKKDLQAVVDILSTPLILQIHRSHAVNIKFTVFEPVATIWRKYNYLAHVHNSNIKTTIKVGDSFKSIVREYLSK